MRVKVIHELTHDGVAYELGSVLELDPATVHAIRGAVEAVAEEAPPPRDMADDAPAPVPVWASVE